MFRSIVSQMQRASLNIWQAPEKSRRHRRHHQTHKKVGQRTFTMVKKAGGGVMKIPKIQVNFFSMVENVWKCDSLSTKLFQLQMPRIVSHFSWILETKKLRLGVMRRSSIFKQTLKIVTRYVNQFERQQNLKVVFLELNRNPFTAKMGFAFYEGWKKMICQRNNRQQNQQ